MPPIATVVSPEDVLVALLPDLTVVVVDADVEGSINWRREGLQFRDTILVLAPGQVSVIPVFRVPGEGSLVQAVVRDGRGVMNVDVCRTPGPGWTFEHGPKTGRTGGGMMGTSLARAGTVQDHDGGRWPPNLVFVHHEDCVEKACQAECPVHALRQSADQDSPITYAFPRLATMEDVVQWVHALLGLGEAPSPDQEFLAARTSYLDGKHGVEAVRRATEAQVAEIHAWLDDAEVEEAAADHRVGRPLLIET